MSMLKLTKSELRIQQTRLAQFRKYLPTLQLKKAMLQFEVTMAQMEISRLVQEITLSRKKVEGFSPLLLEKVSCNVLQYAEVLHVKKKYENVAGVDIPTLEKVVFREADYFLLGTPAWTDRATEMLREYVVLMEKLSIAEEKRRALEKELRDVSIRVNLFEKVLIPRSEKNISKIRIFLGDQQLAAVSQAKVAKKKIALRNKGAA
ncbi:MAG: V-type ATP synthase subunit D [Chlamydiia bacterium]|nr:V-type ATP synthase subunit D [Chlamydiia bacterium]